jgi:hypothetical protein
MSVAVQTADFGSYRENSSEIMLLSDFGHAVSRSAKNAKKWHQGA